MTCFDQRLRGLLQNTAELYAHAFWFSQFQLTFLIFIYWTTHQNLSTSHFPASSTIIHSSFLASPSKNESGLQPSSSLSPFPSSFSWCRQQVIVPVTWPSGVLPQHPRHPQGPASQRNCRPPPTPCPGTASPSRHISPTFERLGARLTVGWNI